MITCTSGQAMVKGFKITEENKNKNGAKFKFQGQSARSRSWFDLDLDLIEVNFSTCRPEFYGKIFQRHDNTQDTNTLKIFEVPIRNSKCVGKLSFTVMPQCSGIFRSH